MSVDLEIDMSLFEDLLNEDACEVNAHYRGYAMKYHEGCGEWWIQSLCPKCGVQSRILLICDKWKNYMADANNVVICYSCGKYAMCGDVVIMLERKS